MGVALHTGKGVKLGDLRHVQSCTFPPHAAGPICNVISAAIRLKAPVPCNGERGCWRLPHEVREGVLKQLLEKPCVLDFRQIPYASAILPRAWPLPWAKSLSRPDVYWHKDLAQDFGQPKSAHSDKSPMQTGAIWKYLRQGNERSTSSADFVELSS